MLYHVWQEPPHTLKDLDREREKRPDLYQGHQLVGMLMYVSAFAGTLNVMTSHLDFIDDCGINCQHLMPLKAPKTAVMDMLSAVFAVSSRNWARWRISCA